MMSDIFNQQEIVELLFDAECYNDDLVKGFSRFLYVYNPDWETEYSGHTKMSFEAFKAGWMLGSCLSKEKEQ